MTKQQLRCYDLDQADDFAEVTAKVSDLTTHNFSVSLTADKVTLSTNLSDDDILDLASASTQDRPCVCRWLNVWALDEEEKKAFLKLLQRYGVSPRLAHMLCLSKRPTKEHLATEAARTHSDSPRFGKSNYLEKTSQISSKSSASSPETSNNTLQNGSMPEVLDITRDLWHFCTIDWGRHYVCIGYNALFNRTVAGPKSSGKPDVIRVWSSLLLCDDGTVISTFETPPDARPSDIARIRKNQLSILINLSHCHGSSIPPNPMFQFDIRPNTKLHLQHTNSPANQPVFQSFSEGFDPFITASSLFYYLFDDWRATFDLVSGRQHPYRNKLDKLRLKMTHLAEAEDIEALHEIGRQLNVLQRVYRSYETIIDRLLQRQRQLLTSTARLPHQNRRISDAIASSDTTDTLHRTSSVSPETAPSPETVLLPLTTLTRFERLLDRIRLLALTELDDCLAEKESLVLMNFNLLSLKNALSVETLTRTTILLAKVTILFLPVSLMTAYFSLQMREIDELYSLKTYWGCFGVVGVLTVALMIAFGVVSSRVKGRIMYESMWRMGTEKLFRRRRREKDAED
jgi:Mg2+ and Co2+ transporter CorA